MNLNNDLSQRVVVSSNELPWLPSPVAGVQRRMLARQSIHSAENAVATSVVRYAHSAAFPTHTHPQGEEIVVLQGQFSDEHGTYPAGTYIKNPPGSAHAPYSTGGCILFVKLRQLDGHDLERVVVRPADQRWQPGLVAGLEVLGLAQHGVTSAAMVRWAPGTRFSRHQHVGGEEILVLQGTFQDEHGDYPEGTWIRSPHLSAHQPFSEAGCLIFVKTGHLLR